VWILEADIEGCFDHISHPWLLDHIPMDREVLRKWLKCGYMESQMRYATEAGTPQGGVISPTLANMTLDGLEALLKKHFGKRNSNKVNLVRYADDFIITGASKELLEEKVRPLVEGFMAQRGLRLASEKTKITHIDDGFDFLGQHVRKYKGKLIIKPAKKNIKNFLDKVQGIIRENKAARTVNLIGLLNPVIKGWAEYHKTINAKTNILARASTHMAGTVALGEAEASAEGSTLGEGSLFRPAPHSSVDTRRRRSHTAWQDDRRQALCGDRHQDHHPQEGGRGL